MDKHNLYYLQLKRAAKDLETIGDRIVGSNTPITENTLILYDTLQERVGAIAKTVNDLKVSENVPKMVYYRLETEISQLHTDIKLFGAKHINLKEDKKMTRKEREMQIRKRIAKTFLIMGIGIGIGLSISVPKIGAAIINEFNKPYGHYVADYMDENGVLYDTDGDGDYYHWVEE